MNFALRYKAHVLSELVEDVDGVARMSSEQAAYYKAYLAALKKHGIEDAIIYLPVVEATSTL